MGKLVQWLFTNLPVFLKNVDPSKLSIIASKLGAKFKVEVPPTIAGITSTVRKWVQDNPLTSLVVIDVLSEFGLNYIEDKFFDEVKSAAQPGSRVPGVVSTLQAKLKAQRELLTGDGSPDTIHGTRGTSGLNAQETAEMQATIDLAVRAVGSLAVFEALRAAVFAEEADIELYRSMNYQ